MHMVSLQYDSFYDIPKYKVYENLDHSHHMSTVWSVLSYVVRHSSWLVHNVSHNDCNIVTHFLDYFQQLQL